MGQRATKVEIDTVRVKQVYEWLLLHWPNHKIVDEGMKLWKCKERAVNNYVSMAKGLIHSNVINPDIEKLKAESLTFWEDYLDRCRQAFDRKNEAIALKQIDLIKNIINQKMDITSNGQAITTINVNIIKPLSDPL